jgi:SAM-dependent methyltransferase
MKALYSRYWFELRYGIKMNSPAVPDQAGENDLHVKGPWHYEPISHYSFNRMLKNIYWNFRESTFIDFGCGKGAALLLATRYCFKKYIGVEFSPDLVNAGRSNILKFMKVSKREFDYEILCTDATLYQVPAEVNVFYFFNPFGPELLDIVMQNIESSLKASCRDILLLYFNALHKDVIEKYGYMLIYSQPADKINIWYQGGNYAYVKRETRNTKYPVT